MFKRGRRCSYEQDAAVLVHPGLVPVAEEEYVAVRERHESLLEAVTERAITEVAQVMAAAEPDRGDAAEALHRVLTAACASSAASTHL